VIGIQATGWRDLLSGADADGRAPVPSGPPPAPFTQLSSGFAPVNR